MIEFCKTTQEIIHDTSTSAYTAKDVVSAGVTVPMAFNCSWNGGKIIKTIITTDLVSFTGDMRLYLFTDPTEVLPADAAPFDMAYGNSYIGYIDVTLAAVGSVCSMGVSTTALPFAQIDGNKIYGVLTTLATPTPDSGLKITVEVTTVNQN
jgi:hypothetical protein